MSHCVSVTCSQCYIPSSSVYRKAATHDSEIRHLYEEMEAQIKNEKDRLLLQVLKMKLHHFL